MLRHITHIAIALVVAATVASCKADGEETTPQERLSIKKGNECFSEGDYEESIEHYTDALEANPLSKTAKFNLAEASYSLSGNMQGNAIEVLDSAIFSQAINIYKDMANSSDPAMREKANFNLGNIEYHRACALRLQENNGEMLESDGNQENSQQLFKNSVEYYKNVLRSDPSNMQARENLLVAMLQIVDDQNQQDQQNQDNQQDQQDQQNQQDQQDQEEQQNQSQPNEPEQPQMSQSAQQILQSIQNKENETRRNVQPVVAPISTEKPW